MITLAFDKHYECPDCEKDLKLHEELSSKTWLCPDCSTPVHVRVADEKGNSYTLERKPAKSLQVGDLVILEPRLDRDYQVLSSTSAGKGKWRLALKQYRAITVDANDHYSIIVGGWL